jgi:hypothetical protein
MAQAPDALGETIVADGAGDAKRARSRWFDERLPCPTDLGWRRIRPARTPRHVRFLQSQAVSETTMLAAEVFVRSCVHAEVSSQ